MAENKIDIQSWMSPEQALKQLNKCSKINLSKAHFELWIDRRVIEDRYEKVKKDNRNLLDNEQKGITLMKGLKALSHTVSEMERQNEFNSNDRTETVMHQPKTIEIKGQEPDYKTLYSRLVGEINMFEHIALDTPDSNHRF